MRSGGSTSAPRTFHRPKVAWYSSDELSTSVRRLITEALGIPVLSTYQAIEAFKVGFECDHHRGLHLNTVQAHSPGGDSAVLFWDIQHPGVVLGRVILYAAQESV